MDFEPALVVELDDITALNHRIYPITAPEQPFDLTTPYLIYISSAGQRTKTIGEGHGTGKRVSGELNVIAPRYSDMKSITLSVIDEMISWEQTTMATTGPYIQALDYEDPVEMYEDKPKLWRCVIEFAVYFDQGG